MTAIALFPAARTARAIKRRLWNPPNGRQSSELEIITGPELRNRNIQKQLEERARIDFELQAKFEDERAKRAAAELLKALEDRARTIRIARVLMSEEECRHEDEIQQTPLIGDIIKAVCQHYRVSKVDLLSGVKASTIVTPRHVAMYLARTITYKSLPEIGRRMNRDHTSVMHGYERIKQRLMQDEPQLKADIAEIAKNLGMPV